MNHYTEAVIAGLVSAALAGIAGVGARMPDTAPTPAALSAPAAVDVRPPVPGPVTALERAFNKAQMNLTKAQWRYGAAIADRTRATRDATAAGRAQLDARIAAAEQARQAVQAARAALAQAQRNLEQAQDATALASN